MYKFPIGVIVDSFRLPIPEAVKKAAEIGAQGIQVYATRGAMAPENLVGAHSRGLKPEELEDALAKVEIVGERYPAEQQKQVQRS